MKHSIWKVAVLAVLCLCMGMTTAFAEGTAEILQAANEYIEKYDAGLAEKAAANTPRILTLANGVQVQRVPSGQDTPYNMGGKEISFNMTYADAEKRGCAACHNLNQLSGNLSDYVHISMENAFGIEGTVQMCIHCHTSHLTLATEENFGDLMHSLHKGSDIFAQMGGDCWSCHYSGLDDTEMSLWDNVKHRVMRGITKLSSDQMDGTFSWNQDKVMSADEAFQFPWITHTETDLSRAAREATGLKPDPKNDGVYDAWMLTVNGDVENPTVMSINDWIAAIGTEKVTLTQQCVVNPMGGMLVSNCEITALNVEKMVEYCKPVEGANALLTWAYSNWIEQVPVDSFYVQERTFEEIKDWGGMYVALEIGGEPIPYGLGYPTQLYFADSSGSCIKEVSEFTVVTREPQPVVEESAWGGTYTNATVAYLAEGQILPAGEPHVFEGYAHQMRGNIASIELSFDQGATWLNFPIENADKTRWVWWNYEWTPPAPGAYTITIRATGTDGVVMQYPYEVMFNVK